MCIFCDFQNDKNKVLMENEHFYAIYDGFPVTKGHLLLISKRHVENYFELNEVELKALSELIRLSKQKLDLDYSPSGYNLGTNVGRSAGETIMHCHIHLIPRYDGDMDDPTGGVRGVIPEKQKY